MNHRALCGVIVLLSMLAACGTPTPAPLPTAVPTEPPTSTLVAPTATSVPTNTPVPPTNTLQPTATPRPTETPAPTSTPLPTNTPKPVPTKAVTPKPTNTKGATAPVSTGGGVSSQPSTLEKSVQQTYQVILVMRDLLAQAKDSSRVDLCAPLLEKYQSLHNAPTYDMNGQTAEAQNAYSLYRQAIGAVDEQAGAFQACGSGGGTIGGLGWSNAYAALNKAEQLMSRAQNWAARMTSISASTPLGDAIKRVRLAVSNLLTTIESPGKQPCGPFVAEGNIVINAPTYDVSKGSAAVQNAYALYRRGVDIALEKAAPLVDMCNKGGGRITAIDNFVIRDKFREAVADLDRALAALQP